MFPDRLRTRRLVGGHPFVLDTNPRQPVPCMKPSLSRWQASSGSCIVLNIYNIPVTWSRMLQASYDLGTYAFKASNFYCRIQDDAVLTLAPFWILQYINWYLTHFDVKGFLACKVIGESSRYETNQGSVLIWLPVVHWGFWTIHLVASRLIFVALVIWNFYRPCRVWRRSIPTGQWLRWWCGGLIKLMILSLGLVCNTLLHRLSFITYGIMVVRNIGHAPETSKCRWTQASIWRKYS